jgi:branched-chain amino acid transport system substrate-binding protein
MNRGAFAVLPVLFATQVVCHEVVGAQSRHLPDLHSILEKPAAYHGPGRDEGDLELEEIPIGLFAPIDPPQSIGHRMWQGAVLAIEKANADGGFQGKPFRLVRRWATDPWRGGSNLVVRMVYEDEVLGIIGGPDGDTTHILEQIATKLRVPILSPVSSDPSLTRVAVPWIFMLPPDDTTQASLLADAIMADERKAVALITSTNHDGRTGAKEMLTALQRHRIPPVSHVTLPAQVPDVTSAVNRTQASNPDALVVWCDSVTSSQVLNYCRKIGYQPPLYSPLSPDPPLGYHESASWGAKVVWLVIDETGDESESRARMDKAFLGRFEAAPDPVSRLTYDATTLLITAVRRAGLNRTRVRDELAALTGFEGVCGRMVWDNGGGNTGFPLDVRTEFPKPTKNAP